MRRILLLLLIAVFAAAIGYLFQTSSAPDVDPAADRPVAEPVTAAPSTTTDPTPPPGIREEVVTPRPPGEPPASYVAALGAISGRVVDAEHVPMPDFPVELVGSPLESLLPVQDSWLEQPDFDLALKRLTGRTDAAGRFRIERVEPTAYHLFHLGGGTAREKWDLCAAQPESGKVIDVGDLVLDRYAVISGRVIDAKGAPLAKARVRATPMPAEFFKFGGDRIRRGSAVAFKLMGSASEGREGWQVYDLPPVVFRVLDLIPYREATSGDDGTFRIEGVPLGMITVVADQPGCLPGLRGPVNTKDGGEKTIGDVKIHPGETLSGRVIDGSDEGVAQARVLAGPVLAIFPVAILSPLDPTTADGSFRGEGFSDEAHVVAARRREASQYVVEDDVVPGIDEPELRVDETTTLTVLVKDAAGEIVRAPRILVQPDTEMSKAVLLQPPLDTTGRTVHAEDGSVEVSGLSRAKFNVFARKDGFALGKGKVDLTNGPASAEIQLVPERVGTVRVIAKESGAPIEHALVVVLDDDAEDGAPIAIPIAPIASGRTDENGIVVLKGLDEGRQFVRALHPAFAAADSELVVPGAAIVMEMTEGGRLKGRLLRDGTPITESYIVIAVAADNPLKVLPRATLASAIDGTYEFSRLPAGAYWIQAAKSLEDLGASFGGGAQSGLAASDPFSAALLPLFAQSRASVQIGGVTAVDASEPVEVEAEENESSGVHVEVSSGAKPPRKEGPPDLDDGPAPKVDPGYRAVVKEGQETWLEIDLARLPGDIPKARLSGVVFVNGAPTADLSIHAEPPGGSTSKVVRTDAKGRFDFGEVPAGALRVRVVRGRAESVSDLAVSRVVLEANETRSLDLRIEACAIEGKVRATSDGRFLSEASVRLVPLDSKGELDLDGCFQVEATDSGGAFRFEVVPQGRFKIEVKKVGFAAAAGDPFDAPSRGVGPRQEIRLIETVRVAGKVELPDGVTPPEMLFVHFPSQAQIDFSGLVFVDPKAGTFEVEGIAPGDYEVNVYGTDQKLSPVKLHVPFAGLPTCVLHPELAPPPTPKTSSGK